MQMSVVRSAGTSSAWSLATIWISCSWSYRSASNHRTYRPSRCDSRMRSRSASSFAVPQIRRVLARQEARADVSQLVVRYVGHRAFVQRVPPVQDVPCQPGRAQLRHGGIAVCHVQRRRPRRDRFPDRRSVRAPARGRPRRTRPSWPCAPHAPLEVGLLRHRRLLTSRPTVSPATGMAGAIDDHEPVREVGLPLPHRPVLLGKTAEGSGRTVATPIVVLARQIQVVTRRYRLEHW